MLNDGSGLESGYRSLKNHLQLWQSGGVTSDRVNRPEDRRQYPGGTKQVQFTQSTDYDDQGNPVVGPAHVTPDDRNRMPGPYEPNGIKCIFCGRGRNRRENSTWPSVIPAPGGSSTDGICNPFINGANTCRPLRDKSERSIVLPPGRTFRESSTPALSPEDFGTGAFDSIAQRDEVLSGRHFKKSQGKKKASRLVLATQEELAEELRPQPYRSELNPSSNLYDYNDLDVTHRDTRLPGINFHGEDAESLANLGITQEPEGSNAGPTQPCPVCEGASEFHGREVGHCSSCRHDRPGVGACKEGSTPGHCYACIDPDSCTGKKTYTYHSPLGNEGCPACKNRGWIPTDAAKCEACGGSGENLHLCPNCDGNGCNKCDNKGSCPTCNGIGQLPGSGESCPTCTIPGHEHVCPTCEGNKLSRSILESHTGVTRAPAQSMGEESPEPDEHDEGFGEDEEFIPGNSNEYTNEEIENELDPEEQEEYHRKREEADRAAQQERRRQENESRIRFEEHNTAETRAGWGQNGAIPLADPEVLDRLQNSVEKEEDEDNSGITGTVETPRREVKGCKTCNFTGRHPEADSIERSPEFKDTVAHFLSKGDFQRMNEYTTHMLSCPNCSR